MRVELGLALAGIRHRPGPWILLAAGVALATMLPLVAAGMRTEAAVAAVETAVQEVPPPSRTVLAVTGRDLRGAALEKVDGVVRDGFGAAGVLSPVQSLTFRPLSLAGQDLTLGAMDRLDSVTRLTAGRLPASCTPTRCEVLQVRPPGARQPPRCGRHRRGSAARTDDHRRCGPQRPTVGRCRAGQRGPSAAARRRAEPDRGTRRADPALPHHRLVRHARRRHGSRARGTAVQPYARRNRRHRECGGGTTTERELADRDRDGSGRARQFLR